MAVPRFLRVITAPRQVFGDPGTHGMFTLACALFLEFVLIYPSALTTCVFRLVGAPGHALWSFAAAFSNYAISVVFAVIAGGWMLYFAARMQKQQLQPWRAASALSYAWMPHVLVVCLGAVVTACGLRLPIFPQVRDVALAVGGAAWWTRQALHWLPMAVWTILAARTLLNPETTTPSAAAGAHTKPVAYGCALLMLAAPVATAAHVRAHWADVQPVRLGRQMPHFQVAGIERDDLDSDSLLGQVVLLNFWATWCGPCVEEMPRLQHAYDAYHERGLMLVGLNIEADNLPAVKAFLDTRGINFPVYADWGAQVQERFGVHTFPTSFLIDRHGVVQEVYLAPPDENALRARIETLLGP